MIKQYKRGKICRVNMMIDSTKSDFIRNQLLETGKNPKKNLRIINSMGNNTCGPIRYEF